MESAKQPVIERKRKTPDKGQLLRIGGLARSAGVSVPTIHYYLKEGLLPGPVIKSRNMAYYDPASVEDVRAIKDLQAKRYLPLSVIKLLLQARSEGQPPAHVLEMSTVMGDVFRPVGNGGVRENITASQFARQSGLSRNALAFLRAQGLLSPVKKIGIDSYDDVDVRLAAAFKELLDQGITLDDLKVFGQYLNVMRCIAETIHARVHELHKEGSVRLGDLAGAMENLRTLLSIKVHRQMFAESHK
jgi:DNA-binding transcriptional MerR regulator